MDSETARQIVMKLSGIIKHLSRMVRVKFGADPSKELRPSGSGVSHVNLMSTNI